MKRDFIIKMKKFSEILTETVLEKESKQEVDSIINEGIVDGFKKLATASKEKLSNFKNAFVSKTKDILSKTLGSLVKSLIESIQTKKTADVKSQMEENPLFKEFLSETNAINEISSDFDKNAVKSVIGKKGEVAAESIQSPSNKNIISEDIADSVDTITTKIFSSVYNVISKVLEKIGYVIKPEFRNWYDRLVRKVQKKFYSTKLGQSIKDLPPEVEQDVMQKFQAIIGIVVIIVMIWIITSVLNGDSNEISTAATGGAAAEELDNAADAADAADTADAAEAGSAAADTLEAGNAGSVHFYKLPGGKDLSDTKISYSDEPPEIFDMKQKYIEERLDAIEEANPNLSSSALRAAKSKIGMEYDYAFANGKILSIKDGNISAMDANTFSDSLGDPKTFLENTGALDGKVANLDALNGLDDKFTVEQLADAGVETVTFESYGVPVKIDISKISDADKSLNPTQLAQKYVKEVAERAAKAKAEEEELGI
jgi:hypothetical protein